MIDVSLDTWVSIAALLGVGISLMVYLRSFRAELKGDIAGLRTELKGDISEFRTELKGDLGELRTELKGDISELRTELKGDVGELRTELKGDITRLDERIYALALGLRPVIENAATLTNPATNQSRSGPRSGGASPRRA